jgi:hypothetical protein
MASWSVVLAAYQSSWLSGGLIGAGGDRVISQLTHSGEGGREEEVPWY